MIIASERKKDTAKQSLGQIDKQNSLFFTKIASVKRRQNSLVF